MRNQSLVIYLSIILGISSGLMMMPEANAVLQYERQSILAGEFWRLLTGHFLHLSWSHWLMNSIALVLITVFFADSFNGRLEAMVFLICSLGVSFGLLGFNPEIHWYVGLSGVVHGLIVYHLLNTLRLRQEAMLIFLFVLIGLKLLYEQLIGTLPGSAAMAGGDVIVDAHLYGAVSGLLAGFIPKKYLINN